MPANYDIRISFRHLHLYLGFLTDNGLVHQHMVEHAAQSVLRIFTLGRVLDRFADGDAEAAGAVRSFGQDRATGVGIRTRTGDAVCAVGLHHRLAVRLLLEADRDHVNLELDTVEGTGIGQR